MKKILSLAEYKKLQRIDPIVVEWENWLREFVGIPNKAIDRVGAVCPCVPKALRDEKVYVVVIDDLEIFTKNTLENLVVDYSLWFKKNTEHLPYEQKAITSISLLFPEKIVSKMELSIIELHTLLKPQLMPKGIMIGEFKPSYSKSSVRNKEFHPLSSPVHALVIRHISHHDKKFVLNDERLSEQEKKICLKSVENFT